MQRAVQRKPHSPYSKYTELQIHGQPTVLCVLKTNQQLLEAII